MYHLSECVILLITSFNSIVCKQLKGTSMKQLYDWCDLFIKNIKIPKEGLEGS